MVVKIYIRVKLETQTSFSALSATDGVQYGALGGTVQRADHPCFSSFREKYDNISALSCFNSRAAMIPRIIKIMEANLVVN